MADLAAVADRVAGNVNRPAGDPVVVAAVDAAAIYVSTYAVGDPDGDPAAVPDDALTASGLVVFSTRLYLDQWAPNGAMAAVGDTSVDPVFTPEDVYRHVHHYFDRLATTWGIA